MRLIVIHHHFRPGGVRRVIELGTPHLVAGAPERVSKVILVGGEGPDAAWLRAFRRRLAPCRVEVMVEPCFGYLSELRVPGPEIERRIVRKLLELRDAGGTRRQVWWAHNLGLGRNFYLTRSLTTWAEVGLGSVVMHHHDWWFENRWHHLRAAQVPGCRTLRSVAEAVLRSGSAIAHVAINSEDAAVLDRHFGESGGWLPNPVEAPARPRAAEVRAARGWLSAVLGEEAPVWLLPCRLLRRKNIAEALLLTRWLRPEAWLVTTGGASSAEEEPYAAALEEAARAQGWRLRLGILRGEEPGKPSVPELLAASEAVLLTSLQEGFGLPYVEAAAARRPLIARSLPNIAPDLAAFGFEFPQDYRELWVEPTLFDWAAERERQAVRFRAWKEQMPSAVGRLVGKPMLLEAGASPRPVSFARLTLEAQLEVLGQPLDRSWALCRPLNRPLERWRRQAAAGALTPSPWPRGVLQKLGGRRYAEGFFYYAPFPPPPRPCRDAGQKAQRAFLRLKLRPAYLYPLLWPTL